VLTRVAQVFSLLTFGKTLAQSALHGVRHHETPRDGRRLRAGAGFSSFVRAREPHPAWPPESLRVASQSARAYPRTCLV